MVAACDKEILGEILSEGELEIHVKEDFYKGEVRDHDELAELLSTASIANLVGNRAVEAAVTLGHVNPDHTITIDGVRHAQFTVMED